MTENKRYNIKPSNIVEDAFYIKDDEREHSFPTVDDKSHLIMYEKALNEQEKVLNKLAEENKQLKQINSNLQDFRNFITERNIFNEKQRKELQLQMLRLYNYFENWFEDSMSHTAFSEMWDNVKEDEKWEKR